MKDKRLLGVDESNRGYSSFFFNRNNTKDHCVVGQSDIFKSIRIIVAIILILLLILAMIAVPYLIINYYDGICETIKKVSDRWYDMWSAVVVIALVEYFALFVDLYVIIYGLYEHTNFDDVKWYYFLGLMFVMAHFIVNLSSTIIAASWLNMMAKIRNSPILLSFQNHLVYFVHCVVIAEIVLALQLILYHLYYIILAFIASPLHALAFLTLYVVGIISFIVFVAFFLKALFHPRRRCLIVFLFIVFIALLLFVYVSMQIIILVGEHHYYGGVISFIGELTPSILLAAISYFGRKGLNCVNAIQKTGR